jgi:hypothetical protein
MLPHQSVKLNPSDHPFRLHTLSSLLRQALECTETIGHDVNSLSSGTIWIAHTGIMETWSFPCRLLQDGAQDRLAVFSLMMLRECAEMS